MNKIIPFYKVPMQPCENSMEVPVAGYANQVSVYTLSPETNNLLTKNNSTISDSGHAGKKPVRKRTASQEEATLQTKIRKSQPPYSIPLMAPTSEETMQRAEAEEIPYSVLSSCDYEGEVEEYVSVDTWNKVAAFSEAIMSFAGSGTLPRQEVVEDYLLTRCPDLYQWMMRLRDGEAEFDLTEEDRTAILWLDLVTDNYLSDKRMDREELFHWRDVSGCCLMKVPEKHPVISAIHARAQRLSLSDLLHVNEYKGPVLQLCVPVKGDWDKTTEFAEFILNNENLDLNKMSHYQVCQSLLETNADLYMWLYRLAKLEQERPHDTQEVILALWQDITIATHLGDDQNDAVVSDQFFNWRKLPAPDDLQDHITEENRQKELQALTHPPEEENTPSMMVSIQRNLLEDNV